MNTNPNKKRKILIVFYDIIADMFTNKKLNPIVAELFIWGRKINISVFIMQSCFMRLKSTLICYNKLHLIIHQILTFKTL